MIRMQTSTQSITARRHEMFQDSLSEGHIYMGRFAMIVIALAALTTLLTHL